MKKTPTVLLCVLLALSLALLAQEAKETAKRPAAKSGILQPQMTPTAGAWDKPHGELGQKPAQPWSVTTIEAAVDGKPNPGRVMTVTGEIIDYSCYLQVGKHGDKHRDCAQKCFKNGQPIGLVTKNGTIYLLMEEEHHPRRDSQTNFREAATEHAGHIMTVIGTASTVNGQRALFVTGFLKK
jgi:hypothetical protein